MAVALVVVAGVTSACTSEPTESPSPSPVATDASLAQLFSRPQGQLDSPTRDFIAAHSNLLWATSRALIIEDESQWWVVRGDNDDWCVIGSLPQGELAANTLLCVADEEFKASGIKSFVAGGDGNRSDIWFIPDDLRGSDQESDGWTHATPNVLVPTS